MEGTSAKPRKARASTTSPRKSRVEKNTRAAGVTKREGRRSGDAAERLKLETPEMTPDTSSGRGMSEPVIKAERETPFTPIQPYLGSPSPSPSPNQSFSQGLEVAGMDMLHSFDSMYPSMIGDGYGNGMGVPSPMGMELGMHDPFSNMWSQDGHVIGEGGEEGDVHVKREPKWNGGSFGEPQI